MTLKFDRSESITSSSKSFLIKESKKLGEFISLQSSIQGTPNTINLQRPSIYNDK